MWLRFKRRIVGLIGLAIIACSILATCKLLVGERFTGSWDSWLLWVAVGILFCLGCFTTHIAFRGSDQDIDDFNLSP